MSQLDPVPGSPRIMISRSRYHTVIAKCLSSPDRVDFGRLSMRKAHAPARHRLTQPTGLEKKVDVQFARRCGTAQHGLKSAAARQKRVLTYNTHAAGASR